MTLDTLTEITEKSHEIMISMIYATKNNFTKKIIYTDSRCFLHPDAIIALEKAIDIGKKQGYRLKIVDAFRPTLAQWTLWEHTPDPNFLMEPWKGSIHSMGVAIDATLLDESGKEQDMGTNIDAFCPESAWKNKNISKNAHKNRLILLGIMTLAGWEYVPNEWWHFQLPYARVHYCIIGNTGTKEKRPHR